VSLACGHTVCRTCLDSLQMRQCPFDSTAIGVSSLAALPVNTALLQLIGSGEVPTKYCTLPPDLQPEEVEPYKLALRCVEELALQLKPSVSSALSRPMQRKLVTLINCQLLEQEGRARGARAARSLGERSVTELILQHQNPQQLSANLWAAVRARGCQFLGPAMQEEVLKLVLLALEDGSALSRKVLVMFVVQRLEPHFPQASKTSIGHVVQLLYRASCFKVTKRDGDSSLMQLKEEFRTYDTLRREHDTQIVQIATEGGLRIAPDQWSSLLYGDSAHKSHMQSIMDKLQTPQSFGQSVQELVIALQRTGDPGGLASLRSQLDCLTGIDPSPESESPPWSQVTGSLLAAKAVVAGLVNFCSLMGHRRSGEATTGHVTRYKTSLCRDLATHGSCPRGQNCTFAHSQAELEMHRSGAKKSKAKDGWISRDGGGGPQMGSAGAVKLEDREALRQDEANKRDIESQPRDVRSRMSKESESVVGLPPTREQKMVAAIGPPPVAQVAPIPRVLQRGQPMESLATLQVHHQNLEPLQHQQLTPIVDMHGAPMLDAATGHPLVAAPVQQQQYQLQASDMGLYTVQPGQPLQIMAQLPPMMAQPPPQQLQQQMVMVQPQPQVNQQPPPPIQIEVASHQSTQQAPPSNGEEAAAGPSSSRREVNHELSPEIASKSLSALKDRKEEILSELGDIVGSSAANAIGDMACQQAATVEKFAGTGMDMEAEQLQNRRPSISEHPPQQHHQMQPKQPQQPQDQQNNGGTYGIWTSKPLVTMNMLTAMAGSRHAVQNKAVEVEPLPDGICVSRFGPISRKPGQFKGYTEPTAVTAGFGLHTRSTSTLRQPLPATSPNPENMLVVQDHNSVLQFPETAAVFEYDPGFYTEFVHSNIQEGMESVSMSHLVHPPYTPISPLPDPRDQTASSVKHNSQSLTMAAESARIQKELSDLQRRISCLSVAENSNQMAMKRDRLAIELRMIESGIRDRHHEICQNQTYPHSDTRDEVSTDYTYW